MENGSPLEATRNNVGKETSWANQGDEEEFKKNIMHLLKNGPSKSAENMDWTQFGKKGKSISPRKSRIQTKSKQKQ